MFCSHCGNPLVQGAKFCAGCGKTTENSIENLPAKKQSYRIVIFAVIGVIVLIGLVAGGYFIWTFLSNDRTPASGETVTTVFATPSPIRENDEPFLRHGNNDVPEPAPVATPAPVDHAPPIVVDPTPPPVDNNNNNNIVEPALPQIAAIARPAGLVYSLETDGWVQSLDVGARGVDVVLGGSDSGNLSYGSFYLAQAGSPSWTIVEGSQGNAIRIGSRENGWYGLDLQLDNMGLDFPNNHYILRVTGNLAGGGTMVLGGPDEPWAWLAWVETDGPFDISLILTPDIIMAAGERGWIRIQADPPGDITIDTITVARHVPLPSGVVYQMSLDPFVQMNRIGNTAVGHDANFLVISSPVFNAAGSPRFTIVEGPYGNAIRISGRGEVWYALDVRLPEIPMNTAENTYTLTVRGHLENGGTAILSGADAPWGWLANVATDGEFVLTMDITATTPQLTGERNWVRIQSDNVETLTVYEIIIATQ